MSSIFDIIGPVMIGPSSSHTAGAARLGKMALSMFHERPESVTMTLYGSFAKTYRGHGTNRALVAGLLGMDADDARIRDSLEIAEQENFQYIFIESEVDAGHPNTVRFNMYGKDGKHMSVTGSSLGGGRVAVTNIDGIDVEITGEEHQIIVFHTDQPGVIAGVTHILGLEGVNISSMRVFRKRKGSEAVMLISTDSDVDAVALQQIKEVAGISSVMYFEPLE